MHKRYKIEITEIGEELKTIGKSWGRINDNAEDNWGYTPETEATRGYERSIYRQQVSELDLPEVIRAINKI